MEQLVQPGIDIILWIQSLGEWLTTPMKMITFLGDEEFYLLILPVIYWCLDTRLGLRLGLSVMLSAIINTAFKIALHGTRPYWTDPHVRALSAETSFGAPSGHSQNAVVIWGIFAKYFNTGWSWLVAFLIIGLIGFSRMYLGVHFLHDVISGWLIGGVILLASFWLERPLAAWIKNSRPFTQYLTALGVSLFSILLVAGVRLSIGSWQLPTSWIENASLANPSADPIAPLALSGVVSNAGTFLGLTFGAIWLHTKGWFNPHGPLLHKALRYIIGIIGVFILWFGLGEIFPRGETFLPFLLRYSRYALVGLWVSGLAPWLFIKLKIAQSAIYTQN